MNNTILDNVILLSEDKTLNGEKFDKLAKKTCMLVERLDEDTYTMKDNIKRNLLVPITFATALKAIFQESYDIHRREKAASKVLGIDMKQITGDLATFIGSEKRYPFFVSDFQYDASVSLDRMDALKLIWGDANFEKLHDFNHLNSLRVVMGNVYTSTAQNPEGLKKLRIVTKDLHLEEFDNIDFLDESLYVGGNIYTKNGVLSLEDRKPLQKKKNR